MVRPLSIGFWVLAAPLGLLAGQPPEKAPKAPPSPPVVTIEFPERKLPPEERSAQAERKAILAATAVLKTERPIRYRSVVLPPGAYPVHVAGDEAGGRNLFFVIGAEGSQQAPAKASGGNGDGPEAGSKPEEKKGEKSGGKATAAGGGNGNGSGQESAKSGGDGSGKAPGRKPSSGSIRAVFHLVPGKAPADALQFSVGSSARANRFTLTVKAGSSEGKATLRFAD